ncbi:DUF2271 domain-containing protein [Sphingomonas sp. 22R3R2A-7]
MVAQGRTRARNARGRHQRRDARTRPVQHPLPATLKPGNYVLNVEAARETGGRELVSIPLVVPVRAAAQGAGKTELGAIALSPR